MVAEVGSRLDTIESGEDGKESELGGASGVVGVLLAEFFEFIVFSKSGGSDAVISVWVATRLVTNFEYASTFFPSTEWKLFELAGSPPVHARCRIRTGATGLLHQLRGGRWASWSALLSSKVIV